ncbi:hypothetical protein A2U01_0026832, partial [Trifolium medium]|nr:hypothetical protein [Trifolium medium]
PVNAGPPAPARRPEAAGPKFSGDRRWSGDGLWWFDGGPGLFTANQL